MDHLTNSIVSVALAIVGLATIAVLVSRSANTSGVISSASSGFAQALGAAEAPVTGASSFASLSFGGLTGAGLPLG